MEGLMLARVIRELAPLLPLRTVGWAFPDETTAVLLFDRAGGQPFPGHLVLGYRPPTPVLYLTAERLPGEARSPFQRFLAARVRGDLEGIEQYKLDRVLTLRLSGERGFVDQPPTRVVFEATGRNANVLVLEGGEGEGEPAADTAPTGRILMAAREVTSQRNRFRSVRTGAPYTPPPPYDKLDPRTLSAEEARELSGLPLGRWRERLDGLGPLLSAELARRAGLDLSQAPDERWEDAYRALQTLVADPTVSEGVLREGAREASRSEKAAGLRRSLREPLERRVTLLRHQLGDVERAEVGVDLAAREREEADLLMAYAHLVPPGAESVSLPAFTGEGERLVSPLDPGLSAVQNAEKRYARARRREEVYTRLAEREPTLRAELDAALSRLSDLDTAELPALEALAATLERERPERSLYGQRYTTPGGFEVLVGRNNKENALLSGRVGRSLDYWFHAQGYPGSHVIVRTGGRDLPLPDILYAAQLAAAHSKARGSSNVAVDYTRLKFVWRPRGAAPGQVQYSDQKTVFVDGTLPPAPAQP